VDTLSGGVLGTGAAVQALRPVRVPVSVEVPPRVAVGARTARKHDRLSHQHDRVHRTQHFRSCFTARVSSEKNTLVPTQLAQGWFPVLAIFGAKI